MNQIDSTIKQSVKKQRKLLGKLIGRFLYDLSKELALLMDEPERLNVFLAQAIKNLPYCKYIYVLDQNGIQLTPTLKHGGETKEHVGRNRSTRPYIAGLFSARYGVDFELSSAYISKNKKRPSLTAVQIIRSERGERLGFLGVDYDLRELPRDDKMYDEPRQWRQIKGDPAIRSGLFAQSRAESLMDQKFDDVMRILEELMLQNGVYHCHIHFSSSRVTVWHIDDPYSYRILTMDELSDTEICLAFPTRPYFERNIVSEGEIIKIFQQFSALRFADETVYLRSGSLNLVNGFVGLNFSCDGTHYLIYDDFLSRGLNFWFGEDSDDETDIIDVEGKDMDYLDDFLETLAQQGCLEVNHTISQLDAGKIPKSLAELTMKERQYIHDELKSVMSVYEDGVCSVSY